MLARGFANKLSHQLGWTSAPPKEPITTQPPASRIPPSATVCGFPDLRPLVVSSTCCMFPNDRAMPRRYTKPWTALSTRKPNRVKAEGRFATAGPEGALRFTALDSSTHNRPVNPIGWVQGLQGPGLIAVICALLFVEEVGVPLPFAPGDIVLAIGGIAIAGGRASAAALVGAVAVASVGGAILGREIFALLGWQRLMIVAEPLHARKPLERAAGLLERGGWRTVFTARLIPGLRVHTTQVAGVSRISRLTFTAGRLPASAVYLAAFIGLGAAIGRPILALIR